MNNALSQLDNLNNSETNKPDGKIDAQEKKLIDELIKLFPENTENTENTVNATDSTNNAWQIAVDDYLKTKNWTLNEAEKNDFKNRLLNNLNIEIQNLQLPPENDTALYEFKNKFTQTTDKIKIELEMKKLAEDPVKVKNMITAELNQATDPEVRAYLSEQLLLVEQEIARRNNPTLNNSEPLGNQPASSPSSSNNSESSTNKTESISYPSSSLLPKKPNSNGMYRTGTWIDGVDFTTMAATAVAGVSLLSGVLSLGADDKGPAMATFGLSLLAGNYVKNRLSPGEMPISEDFMKKKSFRNILATEDSEIKKLLSEGEHYAVDEKKIQEIIKKKYGPFVEKLYADKNLYCLFLGKMPASTEKRFNDWEKVKDINRLTVKNLDFTKFSNNYCDLQGKWKNTKSKDFLGKSKYLKEFITNTSKANGDDPLIKSLDNFIANKEGKMNPDKLTTSKFNATYADEISREPEILDVIYKMLTWMNNLDINSKEKYKIFQLYGETLNSKSAGRDIADTALDFDWI